MLNEDVDDGGGGAWLAPAHARTPDELLRLHLLLNACELTGRELHRLVRCEPPLELLRDPSRVTKLPLRPAVADTLQQLVREDFAARELERAARAGIAVVGMASDDYPQCLREIFDPPLILYRRGATVAGKRGVAVVGSRRCTPYGRDHARALGAFLARAGVPVVSGLANGIDQWAHRGCLEAGGHPVAVLGCGIDVVYPPGSAKLHDEVAARGTLVSEFPLGTHPSRHSFPRRNRLVSGLAEAVVIVEAAARSGSLITADHALQQERAVLALPGPIDHPTSRGTNELLRDGALPVLDYEDVLRAIGIEPPAPPQLRPLPSLGPHETTIASCLRLGTACPSELALETKLSYEEVLTALFDLEERALVERCPGDVYRWCAPRATLGDSSSHR
jgi:DNA processing protein